MNYSYGEMSVFSRSLFASLFAGFIATCVMEFFDIFFRTATGYNPSLVINVSTIIFGAFIPCVVAGIIFYMLIAYVKSGALIFRILFLVLSMWVCFIVMQSHYGGNLPVLEGFRGLALGCILILTVFIVVFIPYFFKNNKSFL
ncbi:MAG: hypothetical protein JO072_11615 [Parafilimonas sp.]|nr:hypothetical protein [Parafilimonas sp.]